MGNSITVEGIDAAYGAVRVLEDVSLAVNNGETVVLLGTNGNGKSTLLKCVMGIVRPSAGSITAEIDGTRHELIGLATEAIVDLGVGFVPEGRRLFPKLSVTENLLLGAFRRSARAAIARASSSLRISTCVRSRGLSCALASRPTSLRTSTQWSCNSAGFM